MRPIRTASVAPVLPAATSSTGGSREVPSRGEVVRPDRGDVDRVIRFGDPELIKNQ